MTEIEPTRTVSRHLRSRIVGWSIALGCTTALAIGALTSTGCGGGNGCQACRDDCVKNGIPPSQCNCAGSCN